MTDRKQRDHELDTSLSVVHDYPCNNLLEVGDPVDGITFTQAGYHLQDEVFLSWFARQVPSIGIGGTYSYLGSVTAPLPVCSGG